MVSYDEIDAFRQTLEQLEVCAELINSNSPTRAKIAIILSDNVAEIIMHRLWKGKFEWDDDIKWIVPQKYPLPKKRQIDRYYGSKIEELHQESSVSENIAKTLLICHKYRNAAYHRDQHNPSVDKIISVAIFHAVCDLFKEKTSGIRTSMAGGFNEPLNWLQKYGLKSTFINFADASSKIADSLKCRVYIKMAEATQTFKTDIKNRISAILDLIKNELPWKSSDELDPILKIYEFKECYPGLEDDLSKEYRALRYRIAAGKGDEVSREQYITLEEKYKREYQTKIVAFKQSTSYSTLMEVKRTAKPIDSADNLYTLLSIYYSCDEPLTKFERYLNSAALEWDRVVQMEIDLRRGK